MGVCAYGGGEMFELVFTQPTAVELEILRIIPELGLRSVRHVHAKLAEMKQEIDEARRPLDELEAKEIVSKESGAKS